MSPPSTSEVPSCLEVDSHASDAKSYLEWFGPNNAQPRGEPGMGRAHHWSKAGSRASRMSDAGDLNPADLQPRLFHLERHAHRFLSRFS
jgi:hypothetical protein